MTVRRGVTQARFNRGPATFLTLEIVFTALMLGLWYRSWAIGFGVAMILFCGLIFRPTMRLIMVAYSSGWSVLAIGLGYEIAGMPGAIFIGGFGALVAFGIHMAGVQGLVDSTYV